MNQVNAPLCPATCQTNTAKLLTMLHQHHQEHNSTLSPVHRLHVGLNYSQAISREKGRLMETEKILWGLAPDERESRCCFERSESSGSEALPWAKKHSGGSTMTDQWPKWPKWPKSARHAARSKDDSKSWDQLPFDVWMRIERLPVGTSKCPAVSPHKMITQFTMSCYVMYIIWPTMAMYTNCEQTKQLPFKRVVCTSGWVRSHFVLQLDLERT